MNLDIEIGKLLSLTQTIARDVTELKNEQKQILTFQGKTEERLRYGSQTMREHEGRIDTIERLPKSPNRNVTYSLIIVGFIILSLLVSIK